jgi:cellulose synthase/poly-beta-1,6-N-acetylglucosamine synthase-like glycosyltransferase
LDGFKDYASYSDGSNQKRWSNVRKGKEAVLKKAVGFIFGTLLVGVVFQVGYLLVLTLAAAFYRKPKTTIATVNPDEFVIIIPAHNEEITLPVALDAFKNLKVTDGSFIKPEQILVIADNCSDQTADIARAKGVMVYERQDAENRGKGFALKYAFEKLPLDFPQYKYYAIFDADTIVDPDYLLHAISAMGQNVQVMQGRYDILQPEQNRRTMLMYVAFVLFNHIRPLGRRVLGFSDGLKGNGMVFRRDVLEKHPWRAYSIVEDIEYGTRLTEAGIKVEYVPEAKLYGQAPTSGKQAVSQRMRWEGGRGAQARQDVPKLLKVALKRRSLIPFDRAMDLIIPPLGLLFSIIVFFALVNALVWIVLGGTLLGIIALMWVIPMAGIFLFVLGGLLVARVPAKAFLALAFAPFYILWKLWVYFVLLTRRLPQEWVRTERTKIETDDANRGKVQV